jgi:hypothetical protein
VRLALLTCAAVLALPGAAASSSETLLAFQWSEMGDLVRLVEVDPVTLAPTGSSLELAPKQITASAGSPDGTQVALGSWDEPRVTVVDRASLRVVRDIRLRTGHYAWALAWAGRGRLLALVGSCCTSGSWVAMLDAERGRVVTERAVPGYVRAHARLPHELVLVLAGPGIGPARLAVAAAGGRLRVVALPRTRVGSRRLPGDDYRMLSRTPGLALDQEARRAYVVGADEPVAEIDLDTMRVSYHQTARALQARTKNVRGPYRTALWVGEGVLAFTGWNARTGPRGGPSLEPAGVHLIDTRSWQRRTVAPESQMFAAARGAIAVPLPTGLAVFGTDGAERFRVPGRFSWVQVVNERAYASRGEPGGMVVVDLVTGTAAPSAGARALTLLDP